MIVYFNGTFLPKSEVRISPDDRGFLFADGVYEVMCAWDGQLFQADSHFKRLAHSLDALRIPQPDLRELREVTSTLCFEMRNSGPDGNHRGSNRPPSYIVSNSRTLTPPGGNWLTTRFQSAGRRGRVSECH